MTLYNHPIFDVPEIIRDIISYIDSVPDYVHFTRTFSKLLPFLNANAAYKIYHKDKPYKRTPSGTQNPFRPRQKPFRPLDYLAVIAKPYAQVQPVGPLWLRKDMIMMQIEDMVKSKEEFSISLSFFLGDHFWSIAEYIMENVVGFSLGDPYTTSFFSHGLASMTEARIRLMVDRKFGTPEDGLKEAMRQADTSKVHLFISLYPHTKNPAVADAVLCHFRDTHRHFLDLLLDAGADPAFGLQSAACKVDLLDYLIRKVQLRLDGKPIPPTLLSQALESACRGNNEETVRLLLNVGAVPKPMVHLNEALRRRENVNLAIVDLLLPHCVGRIESFVLELSIRTRQVAIVRRLLDYGAEVGGSTMAACCETCCAEIIRLLAPLIREHKSYGERLRIIGFWKLFEHFCGFGTTNFEAMVEVEAFKVFTDEMGSHGFRDFIPDICQRYSIQNTHPALFEYLMEELLPKTS